MSLFSSAPPRPTLATTTSRTPSSHAPARVSIHMGLHSTGSAQPPATVALLEVEPVSERIDQLLSSLWMN